MSPVPLQDEAVRLVRRSIAAERVATARRRRALLAAVASGVSQRVLASCLNVSQPAIAKQIRVAQSTARPVPEGFTGGSAREIIDQYVAGEIVRDDLIDQLSRWDYAPAVGDTADYFDGGFGVTPGEFGEVGEAHRLGDIDAEVYRAVLNSRAG